MGSIRKTSKSPSISRYQYKLRHRIVILIYASRNVRFKAHATYSRGFCFDSDHATSFRGKAADPCGVRVGSEFPPTDKRSLSERGRIAHSLFLTTVARLQDSPLQQAKRTVRSTVVRLQKSSPFQKVLHRMTRLDRRRQEKKEITGPGRARTFFL